MLETPALAGIHHLKLPVTDLARSRSWYESRLGYQLVAEFVEEGTLMGIAMDHPNGGPQLALRLDPGRAEFCEALLGPGRGISCWDGLEPRGTPRVRTRRAGPG